MNNWSSFMTLPVETAVTGPLQFLAEGSRGGWAIPTAAGTIYMWPKSGEEERAMTVVARS